MNATESHDLTTSHTKVRDPKARLLRLSEVLTTIALGRTMVYALMARGEFPQPLKAGRTSRWVESEVQAWVMRLAEGRTSMSRWGA